MVTTASSIPSEERRTYEQLIDTLQTLFGTHPGFRPVHAKGGMCEGKFTPYDFKGAPRIAVFER